MRFLKMHGLGNDFVILDHRKGGLKLSAGQARKIADRHMGIGCDQVIVLEPSKKADVFMRIYNPDGGEAESCGNATRCVAHLLLKEKNAKACKIETRAGLLPCHAVSDLVEVDMGAPKSGPDDLEVGDMGMPEAVSVNMGNPHCVFFVNNVADIPVETLGPVFENNPLFPDRTNVEFAQVNGDKNIRLRVWERGAGITLACGSGACATIVAAVSRGLTGRRAEIEMDGGKLQLEWREDDGHVLMTGPVAYVFEGEFHD